MRKALSVLIGLAVALGFALAVITAWFAFGFILRIIGFLVAIIGVLFVCAFIGWSWWTECVVEPYRAKRKKPQK